MIPRVMSIGLWSVPNGPAVMDKTIFRLSQVMKDEIVGFRRDEPTGSRERRDRGNCIGSKKTECGFRFGISLA